MKPITFDGMNEVLRPPEGMETSCDPLPLCRNLPGQYPCLISCWELDEMDLEIIKRTGKVWLAVLHEQHPMVSLSVAPLVRPASQLKEYFEKKGKEEQDAEEG